jgi:hypothetical protein
MIKLVMILLGLTCTSFHEETAKDNAAASNCSLSKNVLSEDILNISIFQSVIN